MEDGMACTEFAKGSWSNHSPQHQFDPSQSASNGLAKLDSISRASASNECQSDGVLEGSTSRSYRSTAEHLQAAVQWQSPSSASRPSP